MKTVDFSYFIEKYNSGEMSDAEKHWFEKELEGNDKLRSEVNLRKHTDKLLQNQDILSLRNKLSSIEKSRAVKESLPTRKKSINLKYAAVIAVIVSLGIASLFSGKNLTTDDLLQKYNSEYQPVTSARSAGQITNELFTQGLEYFEIHDYKNAATYFRKVVESEPKDMYANLLIGISNFEISRFVEAKKALGIVIDDNKNLYIDQAQWYLALCFIKTEENNKAVLLLKSIKDEGGTYSKSAKKILRKLK